MVQCISVWYLLSLKVNLDSKLGLICQFLVSTDSINHDLLWRSTQYYNVNASSALINAKKSVLITLPMWINNDIVITFMWTSVIECAYCNPTWKQLNNSFIYVPFVNIAHHQTNLTFVFLPSVLSAKIWNLYLP